MPLFLCLHMIVSMKFIASSTILYGITHDVQTIDIQHCCVIKFLQIAMTTHCASMFVVFVNVVVFLNGATSHEFSLVWQRNGMSYGLVEIIDSSSRNKGHF